MSLNIETRPAPSETPLSSEELRKTDAYWRACNYLSVGMLYLTANPLLKQPLQPEHIKNRLLGHWGSDPGQSLVWVHLNRLIKKYDLNMMYVSGPGHGAPATLANCYLEGTYSEVYPDKSENEAGLQKFFKQFSFPGGIGSHCTPDTPGSIHEGGELGYSLSHACGAAFDNPDLIVTVVMGDGESETGPLAASLHSNKFLNPIRDGAVLPILHLNGYKIANPTVLARIPNQELFDLVSGYGWEPLVVEGDDPPVVHQKIAATLELAIGQIRSAQEDSRRTGIPKRPRWPLIILRTPKGWTAPKEVDGHRVEGYWRAHQVPILDAKKNPDHLRLVEKWMRSYRPEELFDAGGRLIPELKELAPRGKQRMSANPHANGGLVRKPLEMPACTDYAVEIQQPGNAEVSPTFVLGHFLRDIMRRNMTNFRVFGPDETASNKLETIYEVTKKTWMAEIKPEDSDGGELAPDGRVMEMLSEHTLEGWAEGYVLTGRHAFFSTYEAFAHVIDSMVNQHAKWLESAKAGVTWRMPVPSLNLLLTSTVWRQDHNGFTHQDPGFLDVVTNKSADVVRIYLPPDANCLLSVADHCLRSTNYVNVIVADKQLHLQYLDMDAALKHCAAGVSVWDWASNDGGGAPDVVMACAGDVATMEALAATAILREKFPSLKIRFVNVVDVAKLMPKSEHPHGLSDADFDKIFTKNEQVIFNFHGYPTLVHRLAYRRNNHDNMHVHGYREKGSIDTPLGLLMRNQADRFSLAIDAINRVTKLQADGSKVKEWLKAQIEENVHYINENGIDQAEITQWKWPLQS
jgi:xylulose-5-phosphate/fructose-6-phosphate phosphoketolase